MACTSVRMTNPKGAWSESRGLFRFWVPRPIFETDGELYKTFDVFITASEYVDRFSELFN